MKIIEVLVDEKDLINGWREIFLGSDGQPRYHSNNTVVGSGTRITRVRDVNTPPTYPDTTMTFDTEAKA